MTIRCFPSETASRAHGVNPATVDLAIIWHAVMRWRLRPEPGQIFGCTYTGIEFAMLWTAAGSALVEAPIIHLLLRHVLPWAAWPATALGILASIYLVGFAKSLRLCPTRLHSGLLTIRLGAIARRDVAISEIVEARLISAPPMQPRVRLWGLEPPNILVRTCTEQFAFRVDYPAKLLVALGRPSK